MSLLSEFLGRHKGSISETFEADIGGRLKGMPFKVRPLTYEEYQSINQDASSIGKQGRVKISVGLIFERIVLTCCLDPDFSHKDLLDANGCLTPKQLLHALLLPGEVVELGKRIQRLSGFDEDFEEMVNEAKNE